MELKLLLAVPKKDDSIQELNLFLAQYHADLYIFPEGFLNNTVLNEALDVIERMGKYVITGFKDLENNGQHKALVIDNGRIVDEYTKSRKEYEAERFSIKGKLSEGKEKASGQEKRTKKQNELEK